MHIAIIPDGNRRWGKKYGLEPHHAHFKAVLKLRKHFFLNNAEKLDKLLEKYNINEITIYALSTENLKRKKKEVEALFNLFRNLANDIIEAYTKIYKKANKINKNEKNDKNTNLKEQPFLKKLKIRFYGLLHLLPRDLVQLFKKIEKLSKGYIKVNVCIAYGGRAEIIEAIKKLLSDKRKHKSKDITEKQFRKYLWIKSEPDIVIRTGGMIRTSNFLPWQSIYSEWFFLEKHFPELTIKDIEHVIKEFKKRKRNFGR